MAKWGDFMYKDILMSVERPEVYKTSVVNFWDDEHISQHLLKAHLDPNYEGASRKLDFIEQSVKWIQEIMPYDQYQHILDVGCGPGLYAERFSNAGYKVTGIDFSKRSITYAQNSAKQQKLAITYVCQNYLKMDYDNKFDLATFIYCDYGALSSLNRKIILEKIYRSLRSGGKLILDVFSLVQYDAFQEMKTWQLHEAGGFWSAEKYLALTAQYKYPDNVTLEQVVVITDRITREYCIWNYYFNLEALVQEVQVAGFKQVAVLSDVSGKPYHQDSPTIAIILEK